MSTSIAAGVNDLPCFKAFYFYGPYSNVKLLLIHVLVDCNFHAMPPIFQVNILL